LNIHRIQCIHIVQDAVGRILHKTQLSCLWKGVAPGGELKQELSGEPLSGISAEILVLLDHKDAGSRLSIARS
jgi:hypothetical protein